MSAQHLAGLWSIPNPDRGQVLADDAARLVIGGNYAIHLDGRVEAELELRDRRGSTERRSLAGRVVEAGERSLSIQLEPGIREAFESISEGVLRRVSSNLGTAEPEMHLVRQRRFEAPARFPSILFNTLPKSGSRYITRWLASGLGLSEMKVAVSLFPFDLVIREQYDRFARGDMVAQQHLPAHDLNLRFIANRDPRFVVHLRDPRQATVSWTHHLDNFHAHRDTVPACRLGLEAVTPALPADYFGQPFEARLDHQIRAHLPLLVRWIEEWVQAADMRPYGARILLTTFEEFKSAPEPLIERVLAHYSISRDCFDWSARPATAPDTHFRRGAVAEWREVFSGEQQRYAAGLLSGELRNRFGWAD